jgi:dsRNA-specific ribonuclease
MTSLDALWEKGRNLPDAVTPALDELKRHGITHPNAELTNRIRLALTHRSFLYENQDLLPGITPAHLDALTTLGSTFMRRTLAISAYQRFGDISSGLLSREVNHIGTLVPVWAVKAHWLHAAALLGKGLTVGELPKKVTTSLFHQLLGVLCLSGEATAAEGLVAELHQEPTSPGIADPKTTLQEMMTGKSLRYEYSRTGPDHSATFSAVVTDEAGRHGAGSGNSKTAAGQAAAWAFIETYCLHLLPTAPTPTGSHSPNPITSVAAHEKIVFRLQELFSLPDSARGFLSQALIHQSWAYEHAKVIREARQRDNQVLAYLGSVTTNYEYTRSVAISVLNDRSMSDHGINTQRNETYADAFYRTESVMGLLLGRGMARESSISSTVASDAFKAIVGAVFVANRYPVTLGDVWPDAWKPIWDLIAPGQARPVSARERLDQLAALSQLSLEYRIETQGPDHARQFRAIADIDSAALGRLVTITSSFESSKDLAREHCAARLITLFDTLGADTPHPTTESTTSLVQFLVTHLATVFAANPECREIWARKRLLGLHLVHSNAQLLAWAEAVDILIDVGLEPSLVHELAAAYATAMGNSLQAGQGEIGDLSGGSVGSLADAVRMAITHATSSVEAETPSSADGE